LNPTTVDRPQRFGDGSYGRIDLGQSQLRMDLFGVAAGISTANEWWGPMSEFPFVLGNNAPGFPHVFMGSSRPVNVWIGGLHGRLLYADIAQSAFSPVPDDSARRFAAGIVATLQPRGFPGLELGATRFFHIAWPDSGLSTRYLGHLFQSLLKFRVPKSQILNPALGDPGSSRDNQLASVFARWTLPRSGIEVYGEYGREDHSGDAYDLLLEPDHSATYGLGVRKAWRRGASLMGVRVETINYQTSSLGRHRAQGGAYYHTYTRQGHTSRGQLLGTAIAVGNGSGTSVMLEQLRLSGVSRVKWSRLAVRDQHPTRPTDVQHVLRFERSIRRGASPLELRLALDGVYELNRHLAADKRNLRAEIGFGWY
ncbi:MAG: capsule assembly Wzi family protein, partial [Gammaproteobacteria bacterium]